ncbi:hypothetical protein [Parabacteroides johnsonii]|uniref:hypothetical protein n=1 Tax=Parabacteroides johnsonii TaxID=387661 RepID=UPI0011DDBA0A|nr:hypothetical protein [Parabacteroides johnsonii]
MIIEDIKTRMKLTGMTNTQLSSLIDSSQAQISLFFKGEGASLKINSLQKCFDELGMDTGIYTRRYELAIRAAERLKKNSIEKVSLLSKEEMVNATKLEQINQFIDVDFQEFQKIKEAGIVDIESTYPFFRTTVLQLMGTGAQPTKSSVNTSLFNIAKVIGLLAPVGLLAGPIGLGISLGVNSLTRASLISLPKIGKSIYPLISMTELILKRKK